MKRYLLCICLFPLVFLLLTGCSLEIAHTQEAIKISDEDIEDDSADQEDVKSVIDLIDGLNNDFKATDIVTAKTAFDRLTQEKQKLVTNYADLERIESDYTQALLSQSYSALMLNIDTCTIIRNTVVDVWGAAIEDKNADFNDALRCLYNGESYGWGFSRNSLTISADQAKAFVDIVDAAKDNDRIIKEDFSELYALGYNSHAFDALIEVYQEYSILYEKAISPDGSYNSYRTETSEAINGITKVLAILDIVWQNK